MNVLIVTFLVSTSPSGVVTYYKSLADDLSNRNVNVVVIDSAATPVWCRKVLAFLKLIFYRLGDAVQVLFDEFANFVYLYFAVRRQRSIPFDLIHAQDVRSGVAARLALGRNIPVVLTCHFNDDPVTELTGTFTLSPRVIGWLNQWYTFLFRHVKNYIFVSNYAYTKSKHLLGDDINKLILHNTVSIKEVGLTRPASGKLLISNVGYIDERKNQKLLIEVGDELRRRGRSDFTIWLIGDGPKRADYEQLVSDLDLTEQVKFYGRQAAPWQLVAQSDLYVHTALNDNCPYSILEAFAVKTPVLALPVGGIPELLPDHNGRLYGTDVNGITDEIATYFDPNERSKLAHAQTAHAETRLNHQTALTELISFYKQSLSLS